MDTFKSNSRPARGWWPFTSSASGTAGDAPPAWPVAQPEVGCRLLGEGAAEWVVQGVHHDEAGPERVLMIARADLEAGRPEAAFTLALHAWCTFCAGKTLLPPA